jgi:hypothetical protein
MQEYFMINEFQNTWQEAIEVYFEVRTRFSVEEQKKTAKNQSYSGATMDRVWERKREVRF